MAKYRGKCCRKCGSESITELDREQTYGVLRLKVRCNSCGYVHWIASKEGRLKTPEHVKPSCPKCGGGSVAQGVKDLHDGFIRVRYACEKDRNHGEFSVVIDKKTGELRRVNVSNIYDNPRVKEALVALQDKVISCPDCNGAVMRTRVLVDKYCRNNHGVRFDFKCVSNRDHPSFAAVVDDDGGVAMSRFYRIKAGEVKEKVKKAPAPKPEKNEKTPNCKTCGAETKLNGFRRKSNAAVYRCEKGHEFSVGERMASKSSRPVLSAADKEAIQLIKQKYPEANNIKKVVLVECDAAKALRMCGIGDGAIMSYSEATAVLGVAGATTNTLAKKARMQLGAKSISYCYRLSFHRSPNAVKQGKPAEQILSKAYGVTPEEMALMQEMSEKNKTRGFTQINQAHNEKREAEKAKQKEKPVEVETPKVDWPSWEGETFNTMFSGEALKCFSRVAKLQKKTRPDLVAMVRKEA